MVLYIHFGIYKAGSSYIQYYCANNKYYLLENNIYFPPSDQDEKMKAGLISAGNALRLSKALKTSDQKKIEAVLTDWYSGAVKHNTDSVLISSEALVHDLAIKNKIELLINLCHKTGFTEIKAMGFFRDLADHALSTYKHRAKTGRHPDYEHWIKHNYETPELLKNLAQTVEATEKKIEWNLRKFQKDSEFLKQAFFEDWLGIASPVFNEKPTVNESLTLSEVKLMNHLKKTHPFSIDYFVNGFKALSKQQKAKDKDLEKYVIIKFFEVLKIHICTLDKINVFFLKGERIQISENIPIEKTIREPDIRLSEEQLEIISNHILFFNSFAGYKVVCGRRLLKFLKG